MKMIMKWLLTVATPPEQVNQPSRSTTSLDEITASFSSMMSEQKEES